MIQRSSWWHGLGGPSPWWRGVGTAAPLAPGIVSVGVLYGASAVAAGMPHWTVLGSSLLVATGSAQFMAVELLARGAGWWLVVLLGLLVNLRFAVYALHIGPFAGQLSLPRRLLFYGLVNDEGYALTASRWDGVGPGRRADLGWSFAVMFVVWFAWQVGTAIGVVAGDRLPPDLGLEMAVPITLLTVLVLLAGSRRHLVVAVVAGAVALLFRQAPHGLGLLVGGGMGVMVGMVLSRRSESPRGSRSAMNAAAAIAVVLGLGLGTLAFRLVFAELRHRCVFPPWLEAALDWVPVALLAALVAPALVPAAASGSPAPALGAGLVTVVTTYRSRSLLLAVCLGMGTFWALGAFF